MLVYGREARSPISLESPSLELAHQLELLQGDEMIIRMVEFMELEEKRKKDIISLNDRQMKVKRIFHKKSIGRFLKEGDLLLKWDVDRENLDRHSKFDSLWSGPYVISSCKESNIFELSKPTSEVLPIPMNWIHLKLTSK